MNSQKKQAHKYKLMASISRLSLNKSLNFSTKVIWKRNINKAQTQTVTHQNGESHYNSLLELDLKFVYNQEQGKFESKYTQFTVMVIYQGKVKSGGSAKFDAAQIINNRFINESVKINLKECPDPNAFLEITFNFDTLDHCSKSLFNQLSIISSNQIQNDLSQIDFNQEENDKGNLLAEDQLPKQNKRNSNLISNTDNSLTKQISKMVNLANQFEILGEKFKHIKNKSCVEDQNSTKNQSLQISSLRFQNQEKYKNKIIALQVQLEQKDQLLIQYSKNIKEKDKKIKLLEEKINQRNKEVENLKQNFEKLKKIALISSENEQKYRLLHEKSLKQLQENKKSVPTDLNFSKQSVGFKRFLEEVNQVDEIAEFNNNEEVNEKIQLLSRENLQLQTRIASISHNLAQLFNASFEYGGAKLLDYLQNSIGLTEAQ